MHLLARSRMDERELGRVEALPMDKSGMAFAELMICAAVNRIAQQRVAQARHMDADLMGASRFEPALDMAHPRKALQHTVMSDGIARMGANAAQHSHFLAIGRVAADGGIDRSLVLAQIADGDGVIDAADTVDLQLVCQMLMRRIIFRDNK